MSLIKKLSQKLNTVKFKLIFIPLLLLLIAILSLATASYRLVERNMITEMQNLGMDLAEQAMNRIADNTESLITIEKMLEDKIFGAANAAITNSELVSSQYLTELARDLGVDVIHWYNNDLIITASAFGIHMDWAAPFDHQVAVFNRSNQRQLVEDIRQDSDSDDYYKYGYLKGSQGELVQVGILANAVQALTAEFSSQTLLDELAATDKVVYAVVVNSDLVTTAHSNHERIGITFDDEGSIAAAVRGEPYASQYYYEAENVEVYDVLLPFILDGEHQGAINIGLSMAEVNEAVREVLVTVSIIGIVAFILLGAVLVIISMGIVNSLKNSQLQWIILQSLPKI